MAMQSSVFTVGLSMSPVSGGPLQTHVVETSFQTTLSDQGLMSQSPSLSQDLLYAKPPFMILGTCK